MRAVILIFPFLLLLSGCFLFNPRPSEPPSGKSINLSTPENWKSSFQEAFKLRDIRQYLETLHPNFEFLHSNKTTIWSKTEDEILLQAVFNNFFLFSDSLEDSSGINFVFSNLTFPKTSGSDTLKMSNISYTINSSNVTLNPFQFLGAARELWLILEDNRYSLIRWSDGETTKSQNLSIMKEKNRYE